MMLSAVSCHGKIFTITSLQALSLEFFIPAPPSVNTRSWELGNSERQECWYIWLGLYWEDEPAALHASTHSNVWTQWETLSCTQWFYCSRISNKSYYINKKLNKIIILKNFNKKVLLRKHTYLSSLSRHLTKIGRIPDFIKSSMGGFRSLESSFLKKSNAKKLTPENTRKNWYLYKSVSSATHLAACTALSCTTALSLVAFCSEQEP